MNKEEILKEIEEFKKNPPEDITNSVLDEIEQFKAQKRSEDVFRVAKAAYPETLEGKYLQPVYDIAEPVLKGASILEKPVSLAMGAGRSVGKLISGQENPEGPIMEELSSFFPTPAGSLTADLQENEIGTEPLLEGVLPENIKAQFPKASSAVESISPTVIADIGAGAALGAITPSLGRSQAAKIAQENPEVAKKALIRGSERDVKFVGDLQSSGKIDSLANKVLQDKNLVSRLTNPEKMVEYLQGSSREFTDPITGKRNKIPLRSGKLGEVGDELGNSIKKFDADLLAKGQKFDIHQFTKDVVDDIMAESNEIGSGTDFDPIKLQSEVEKYTKALTPSSLQNIDLNRRSYADLVKLKRGAADRIYDMKRVGFANVDNPSMAELVAQKVWSKADKEIFDIADAMQDYDVIKLNNDFSDYQKIRELYANKDIAKKYAPTLLEDLIPMGAIGAGTTMVTGSPYMGLIAAGGYPMARSAVGSMAGDMPARLLQMRQNISTSISNAVGNMNPLMTAGALAAYEVPRNTDKILKQSDMFVAKLMQNIRSDEDKSIFDQVVNVLENKPEQLSSMMPIIMAKYPTIFAPDKYNRINGVVDPMLKAKALEDLVKSKTGTPLEKANKTERLINENILED